LTCDSIERVFFQPFVDEESNCRDKDKKISIDGWVEVSPTYIVIYVS